MEEKDIVFEPRNDMSADDMGIVTQHNNLIKSGNYSDATALLDNNNYQSGFRASLFNSIQNKTHKLQEYLLNEFAADEDEFYSYDEPTAEQMDGKTFWIKPY